MQTAQISPSPVAHSVPLPAAGLAPVHPTVRPQVLQPVQPTRHLGIEPEGERGLADLLRAYRDCGGIGRGDEVAEQFRLHDRELSGLARWIVEREVLSFEWLSELWLPWFQFDPADMSVRPQFRRVAEELRGTFDGLHLSQWFIEPNCWLGDRRPAELLLTQPEEVLQAARTDRFVALG